MVKAYGVTGNQNLYDTKLGQKKNVAEKVKNNTTTDQIAKSSEDKLSSKAKAYLENLRKTYGDYDFIIADEGTDRRELLNQSNKEYSVMFSSAELERMANDEDYAAEQMRKVQSIVDMSNRIFEQFGIDRAWEEGATGDAMINKLAISVNDDGTMTILAEIERFSENFSNSAKIVIVPSSFTDIASLFIIASPVAPSSHARSISNCSKILLDISIIV